MVHEGGCRRRRETSGTKSMDSSSTVKDCCVWFLGGADLMVVDQHVQGTK